MLSLTQANEPQEDPSAIDNEDLEEKPSSNQGIAFPSIRNHLAFVTAASSSALGRCKTAAALPCRLARKGNDPAHNASQTGLRTGQSGGYVHSTSADLKPYQAANVVCIYRMWGQSHTSYRILPIFRDLCKILCDQSKYPPLHLLHSSSCFCKGAEVAESHLDSSASHRTIRPHGCKKRSPK